VDTTEQRKGIGSTFLKHILEQIPDSESIELTVNRQNYKAINFYFKTGFIIKDVADFDIGEGYFMNDFIMIRKSY
jgi:ribosomal protein S18 acetylase RimI-like enzyme